MTNEYKQSRRNSNLSELELNKITKTKMVPIGNYNALLTTKNTGSTEILTPNKITDSGGKSKGYKNYATLWINDHNDVLSTTTDKRTTDERIESSYRANLQKNLGKLDSHKDVQEKKAIQQIEDRLEREYKFYQVKTSMNEAQEKVPEILLRDAADQTLLRLSKLCTQYSKILGRVKEWYNNCIKTALSDVEAKSKEIKKLKREILKNDEKYRDAEKQMTIKDQTISELNKEIAKLRKSKKESDKKYEDLEIYTEELKRQKLK